MELISIDAIGTPPPRKPLIQDIMYEGELSLVYGASGSGKSAIVTSMLALASIKQDIGPYQSGWIDVYWFPTENPNEHCRRLVAMRDKNTEKYGVIGTHYVTRDPLTLVGPNSAKHVEYISEFIEENRSFASPVMVVDTLNQSMPGAEENSSTSMSEVVANLKAIQANHPRLHVMTIHHSGKKKENGPRGHSSLFAAMDTCMFVSSNRGQRCLEITKQRGEKASAKIGFKTINSPFLGARCVDVEYL